MKAISTVATKREMVLPTFLLFTVVVATICTGVSGNPVHSVAPKLTPGESDSYFWFRTEDGHYIKAFLTGGPRKDPRANEENIKFYLSTP